MTKKSIFFALTLIVGLLSGTAHTGEPSARPSVSILGDSYSTFEGYVKPDTNAVWYFSVPPEDLTDVDNVDQTWWRLLLDSTGWNLEQNNSFSGSTICNTGYHGDDYSDRSFITRMDNLGNPDIILVFGATNDSWADAPIGEYKWENQSPEDLYSFRPALGLLLEYMTHSYPDARIIYILNSDLKDEIDISVKTACTRYNVELIELDGIDKINGHPSVNGMKQIASQIEQAVMHPRQ